MTILNSDILSVAQCNNIHTHATTCSISEVRDKGFVYVTILSSDILRVAQCNNIHTHATTCSISEVRDKGLVK